MKISVFFAALLAVVGSFSTARAGELPHMDLEMSSQELEAMLQRRGVLIMNSDQLQPILEMGKRIFSWIEHINSKRPAEKQLVIHTPDTIKGVPITAPGESNRRIIDERLSKLKAEMPQAMWDILYSGAPFSDEPPIADEVFLELARKADSVYNAASRWILQEPYLNQYAARQSWDIRGFYFLEREENRDQKLASYKSLDTETKARLKTHLIGQCINSQGSFFSNCDGEFASSVEKTGVATQFYQKYVVAARDKYDGFFDIQNARRDVTWNSQKPNVFSLPFLKPETTAIQSFLMNIEDEWKWNDWNLKLDFRASGSGMAYVVFVPGATPNVNGLGGNRITMDANRPLDEWTNRWTIRHEFGHVLGLPDCYVEFYDSKRGIMVNYQLDITNLMCSRRGKFKQLHFDELKENYFR
jgi:hypothetical protein